MQITIPPEITSSKSGIKEIHTFPLNQCISKNYHPVPCRTNILRTLSSSKVLYRYNPSQAFTNTFPKNLVSYDPCDFFIIKLILDRSEQIYI